jgi:outer membrane protein OmpA-like peptidoglycan-associated protein
MLVNRIFKWKQLCCIIILFLTLLTGCIIQPGYRYIHVVRGEDYCAQKQAWNVKQQGIEVYENSKMTSFFIPARLLFNHDSANFNAGARKVLDVVDHYLDCYEEEDIRVTGYLTSGDNAHINEVLAMARADRVVKYLWLQEIDASLAYSVGKIGPKEGVEINFRKFYKD